MFEGDFEDVNVANEAITPEQRQIDPYRELLGSVLKQANEDLKAVLDRPAWSALEDVARVRALSAAWFYLQGNGIAFIRAILPDAEFERSARRLALAALQSINATLEGYDEASIARLMYQDARTVAKQARGQGQSTFHFKVA